MFCGNCGEKIPDESIYCMFCGAPAKPAQPDSEAAPQDSGEEWEGREVWEVCRQEQKRADFQQNMPRNQTEPQPPLQSEMPAVKRCRRCGKELAETSISDYCLDCLYSADVMEAGDIGPLPAEYDAPELDTPEIAAPRRHKKFLLFSILAIIFLTLVAAAFLLIPKWSERGEKPSGASQSASQRQDEYRQQAINFAHEMVKAAARAPDSVHFDAATVECSVEAGDYTVVQQFEREDAQGQMITSTYTAVLNLGGEKGYTSLMLQVDDAQLYDYR